MIRNGTTMMAITMMIVDSTVISLRSSPS